MNKQQFIAQELKGKLTFIKARKMHLNEKRERVSLGIVVGFTQANWDQIQELQSAKDNLRLIEYIPLPDKDDVLLDEVTGGAETGEYRRAVEKWNEQQSVGSNGSNGNPPAANDSAVAAIKYALKSKVKAAEYLQATFNITVDIEAEKFDSLCQRIADLHEENKTEFKPLA